MTKAGLLKVGILGIMLGSAGMAADDFTADVTMTMQGQTSEMKLHVTDAYYRMDTEQGGEQYVVIVDRIKSLTRVMLPAQKLYMEMPSQDMISLMNDPFQSVIYTASFAEAQNLGEEAVDDIACRKTLFTYHGTDIMTCWQAEKLNFPMKIVQSVQGGQSVEVGNVVVGPVDTTLFAMPDGFKKEPLPGDEPVEKPEWAAEVSAGPEVTPPFERAMTAGDMIKIKTVPCKSIWIRAVNPEGENVVARAMPFKNGLPLKNMDAYYSFASKGTICTRLHETQYEADYIVVRVFEGSLTVEGKYREMTEAEVPAGETFVYKKQSDDNIETRFVNIGDGPARLVINFKRDGEYIPESELGPITYRMTILQDPGDIKKTALYPKGDEVVIAVEAGKVAVKMGQYDSFEF